MAGEKRIKIMEYTYFVAYQYSKSHRIPGIAGLETEEGQGNFVLTRACPIKYTEQVRDIEKVIKKNENFDAVSIISIIPL